MREHEQVAGGDPVEDLGLPDLGLLLVREQHHHHVAATRGIGDVQHLQPGGLGLGAARGVGAEADDDVVAGLLQVERVGVTLRPVTEDRDRLALERFGVGIGVVEDSVVRHGAGS